MEPNTRPLGKSPEPQPATYRPQPQPQPQSQSQSQPQPQSQSSQPQHQQQPAPAALAPQLAASTLPTSASATRADVDHPEPQSSPSSPPPSNIDPSLGDAATNNATPRPVRKRNRKALSCRPCRNMKVKCDRSMPCDRCVKNNRIGDCVYDGEPESKKACVSGIGDGYPAGTFEDHVGSKHSPIPHKPVPKGPETTFSQHVRKVGTAITHYKCGKARYVGGSHWVHLFGEFEEIGPWYIHRMKDFAASRKEIKFLKKSFKNKERSNFPFCSSRPISAKEVPSLVPKRPLAEMYVKRYMDTFERTHPLFHEPTFRRELDNFWQDPASVGTPWLATFFMMMFLGCWFTPLSQDTERHRDILDRLLDGAQTCLLGINVRARNTLNVVRAYCMIVLAKQCDALSHDDSNVVSVTMAMITQVAIMGGVHRDPDHFKDMPVLEKFIRRRIWNTVLYMNFQNSMDGGVPFLLGPSVYDCPPPLNHNEIDVTTEAGNWHPSTVVTDCSHQIILRSVIAIGTEIVTPINNADAETLPYEAVMKYDYRLTRILDDLPRSLSAERYTGSRLDYRSRLATQKQMVEFFIRSILLVLHRPYSQGAESKEQYPNSYFTALHHATSYIGSRKQLFSDKTVNSVNGIWLAEVFKEMFTLSFLLCYADIRRRDNYDFRNDGLDGLSDETYKSIMESREMGEEESAISEHHFQLYVATALKIPSLFAAKNGKKVIYSEEYIANLNDAVLGAARKVRAALGIPSPFDQNTMEERDRDSVVESAPGMVAATSETIDSASPAVVTPDDPTSVIRISNLADPPPYESQEHTAMPSELFDSLMNDPNLMLDDFFTSFVFGGFQ
ncbi:hypothetical protein H072_11315 [Dactylellina haptotyla CBS 200.50]|uniref:Zn(2)-C6 fungal-type domain-containing protein n=1 Tax=Dactylellina haptotyla (strain CBS 200.50) TaxID=1284197 RepID=S7ZY14_DACHA|nr:hypothetical protein H072_11315 [Dactylellina haptotyla CBS 200.50]